MAGRMLKAAQGTPVILLVQESRGKGRISQAQRLTVEQIAGLQLDPVTTGKVGEALRYLAGAFRAMRENYTLAALEQSLEQLLGLIPSAEDLAERAKHAAVATSTYRGQAHAPTRTVYEKDDGICAAMSANYSGTAAAPQRVVYQED